MTVNELYSKGIEFLKSSCIEDYSFECDCLLEHFSGINRIKRLLNGSQEISNEAECAFLTAVKTRTDGVPLQYIIGKWEFMGFEFSVGEGVLIPRPETELLVDIAAEHLKLHKNCVIYDLCAGSGAVGLSVAKMFPGNKVYLFEKYNEALNYLNKNKSYLNTENAVIIQRDIFDGVCEGIELPDIIISNPPYIRHDEIDGLQTEVGFEPRTALDGGEDGLDFYRCIKNKWFNHIKNGGFLAVECGENQSNDIISIFDKAADSSVIHDYAGIDRIVRIKV